MTRTFPRKYLTTPAAAIGAAALALTVLAPAASATSHTVAQGHWDLVAVVDCSGTGAVELEAENHATGATRALSATVFEVNSTNTVPLVTSDKNRFDPDPFRVLTHDEAQVPNGKLVLGFEVEYENCGTAKPKVTYKVVSSTVPSGERAAAYKNSAGTSTSLDTATGSGLNQGVVTDTHEDRRWGFSAAGSYGLSVKVEVTPVTQVRTDTEPVSFAVS